MARAAAGTLPSHTALTMPAGRAGSAAPLVFGKRRAPPQASPRERVRLTAKSESDEEEEEEEEEQEGKGSPYT